MSNVLTKMKNAGRRIRRTGLYTKGRILSYLKSSKTVEDYPIDIVITWLDGNDKSWIEDKEKYLALEDQITQKENPIQRYRDWGLLPYWFRAIENNAPWVRSVFFITCGQKPDWLNTENSKLRFVSHKDFIPSEYLPTFCSDTIELNLWRIKELSDNFIYLNDDVFLNKPVLASDFFAHGFPKISAIAQPEKVSGTANTWSRRSMNNYAVLNASFDIDKVIESNPDKWFSHVIGRDARFNRRIYSDGYIAGMYNSHSVMPFLKDSLKQVWDNWYELLDGTCKRKFRSYQDVTIYLPLLWSVFQGKYTQIPRHYYGPLIELSEKTIDYAAEKIQKANSIAMCLNDGHLTNDHDVSEIKAKLIDAFEKRYPKKSSFEL